MLKKLFIVLLMLTALAGCERQQQNTNTVFNREKLSDFTTKPQPKNVQPKKIPMLPGKAQVLGAPFEDFQTYTGQAEVAPKEGLTKALPESSN